MESLCNSLAAWVQISAQSLSSLIQSIIILMSSSFKQDDAQCSQANAQSNKAWIKPWLFLVSIPFNILVIYVLYSNNLLKFKLFLKL